MQPSYAALDCFDKCMGEMIVYYSKNLKKFELYPNDEKAASYYGY